MQFINNILICLSAVAKKDNFAQSEPINNLIHKFVPEATKISDVS